jgi:hypothetical protein
MNHEGEVMSAQELLSQRVRLPGPCRISPGTPLGYAELRTRCRIDRARGRVIESPSDLGASVVEWVIISALVVGIAGAVSLILTTKLKDKANTVLDTPAAP